MDNQYSIFYLNYSLSFQTRVCSYFRRPHRKWSFRRNPFHAAAVASLVSASSLQIVAVSETLFVLSIRESIADGRVDDVAVDSSGVISICELWLARNLNFPRPKKNQMLLRKQLHYYHKTYRNNADVWNTRPSVAEKSLTLRIWCQSCIWFILENWFWSLMCLIRYIYKWLLLSYNCWLWIFLLYLSFESQTSADWWVALSRWWWFYLA